MHASIQRYTYRITVRINYQDSEPAERLEWHGLRLDQLTRWAWYFRMRQAQLTIKFPKAKIIEAKHFEALESADIIEQRKTRQAIINAKATITKWKTRLKKFEEHWRATHPLIEMFPITDAPGYASALKKIESKEKELIDLINHQTHL